MVGRLGRRDANPGPLPVNIAPRQGAGLGRDSQAAVPSQGHDEPPFRVRATVQSRLNRSRPRSCRRASAEPCTAAGRPSNRFAAISPRRAPGHEWSQLDLEGVRLLGRRLTQPDRLPPAVGADKQNPPQAVAVVAHACHASPLSLASDLPSTLRATRLADASQNVSALPAMGLAVAGCPPSPIVSQHTVDDKPQDDGGQQFRHEMSPARRPVAVPLRAASHDWVAKPHARAL